MNKEEQIIKKIVPISSMELTLFRNVIYRKVAHKIDAKMFWDNSNKYQANIFQKINEFSIIGNDEQIKFLHRIFNMMDKAIEQYKLINGFTDAIVEAPAIYLKRIVGDYHKNLHYIEKEFQVRMYYDKRYVTDECYPIQIMTNITLRGNRVNIVKAHDYLQSIVNELHVYRTYMSNNEIRIIIAYLMRIKAEIHPTEIRCCRDNALRDINHPFYTIYYKDKEVALVGTKKEVDNAELVVHRIITNNKNLEKNLLSLNYLIPVCNKSTLIKIKNELENECKGSK